MAQTATVGLLKAVLQADTAQFSKALEGASADVKELANKLQKDLEPRQRAVNAAVKDFLGGNEIRRAQEYLQAVQQIGGAAKLVESDQRKVNAAVNDALSHYQKLGISAPQAMVDLEQATRKVDQPLTQANDTLGKIWSGLKSAAGLIGVTFAVSEVINFTKKVFDAASAIHDQSMALGFSAEAFQRNKYAAEQSGGSVEAFTRAANKLNDNLANGDKSTVAALQAAGLAFAEIRSMRPEDAWLAVSDAVGRIIDPMARAQVAQDLFGKGALELLPGMIEGYRKLGEGATVMSEETVKRLEAAQDAWDSFWNSIVIHSGEIIASLADTSRSAGAMSVSVAGYAGTSVAAMQATEDLAETTKTLSVQTAQSEKAMARSATTLLNASKNTDQLTIRTKEQIEADKKGAEARRKYATEMAAVNDRLRMNAALQDAFDFERQILMEKSYAELQAKVKDGISGVTLALKDRRQAHIGLDPAIVDQVLLDQELALAFANLADMQAKSNAEAKKTPAVMSEVNRAIASTLGQLDTAISGTFAQMLLGAKGFKDGFVDIWESIKSSVSRILTDILGDFTHRFIQGLINVITGSEAGFTGAFSGMFTRSINASAGPSAQAASGAGSISGSAWASGFMKVAGPALEAWALWKFADALLSWIGGGSGTGQQTPDEPNYDPNDPNNPNPGGPDPGQPLPDGTMPGYGDYDGIYYGPGGNESAVGMWAGGVVMPRPGGTLARIAEAGYPEAVIPLNGSGAGMLGGQTVVVFEQDGRRAAEFIVPHIPGVMQRLRLA